jgi:chromosome segregation ATPase
MAFYNNRAVVLDRPAEQRSRLVPGQVGQRLLTALRGVTNRSPHTAARALTDPAMDEPGTAAEHCLARFPIARRGYERTAVDEYVAELELELAALDRELAELRGGGATAAEVASEIKRIGEQTSAVLIAAHQQREEILARARAEAERCVGEATATASALTAQCEERLRELEAQTETARGERERLLGDLRTISTALAAVADSAEERIS